MLEIIQRFYQLSKQHWIVSFCVSIGAVIGFLSSMLSIFGLKPYFNSVLCLLLFLLASAFLFWIFKDPKRKITDDTGLNSRDESYFSEQIRRLAAGGGLLMLLMGGFAAYWLRPGYETHTESVRTLLAKVESLRKSMKGSGNGFEIFKRYETARQIDGPQFWNNINVAMEIPVSEVSTHNSLLLGFINDPIVPFELVKDAQNGPTSIDFNWIGDKAMESDLRTLINHYLKADKTLSRIREMQKQNLEIFENARLLNEELCRYYELTLSDDSTYLNDGVEMKKALEAEKRVYAWLKRS